LLLYDKLKCTEFLPCKWGRLYFHSPSLAFCCDNSDTVDFLTKLQCRGSQIAGSGPRTAVPAIWDSEKQQLSQPPLPPLWSGNDHYNRT